MILTIAKGDKGYNNQNNFNFNDNGIHQIDQQLEEGVEIKAAKLKEKVFYIAVTYSSYVYI